MTECIFLFGTLKYPNDTTEVVGDGVPLGLSSQVGPLSACYASGRVTNAGASFRTPQNREAFGVDSGGLRFPECEGGAGGVDDHTHPADSGEFHDVHSDFGAEGLGFLGCGGDVVHFDAG
jgi:hypothetical protein